jgi:hypothetical protein
MFSEDDCDVTSKAASDRNKATISCYDRLCGNLLFIWPSSTSAPTVGTSKISRRRRVVHDTVVNAVRVVLYSESQLYMVNSKHNYRSTLRSEGR